MPSRGDVESRIASWNRKGISAPERGEGKGHETLIIWQKDLAPESAPVPLLLYKYCHGGIEAAQRLKTRPMANLSINPPASILQTGRWSRADSKNQ